MIPMATNWNSCRPNRLYSRSWRKVDVVEADLDCNTFAACRGRGDEGSLVRLFGYAKPFLHLALRANLLYGQQLLPTFEGETLAGN
jgi:hypothetical protein